MNRLLSFPFLVCSSLSFILYVCTQAHLPGCVCEGQRITLESILSTMWLLEIKLWSLLLNHPAGSLLLFEDGLTYHWFFLNSLIFLFLPLESWDYRCALPRLAYSLSTLRDRAVLDPCLGVHT